MFRLRERELQKLLTPGKGSSEKKYTTKKHNLSHILFNTNKNSAKKRGGGKIKKEAENNNALLSLPACLLQLLLRRLHLKAALFGHRGASGQKSRWPTPTPSSNPNPIAIAIYIYSSFIQRSSRHQRRPHCCHQQRRPHGVSVLFEGFYAPYKSSLQLTSGQKENAENRSQRKSALCAYCAAPI